MNSILLKAICRYIVSGVILANIQVVSGQEVKEKPVPIPENINAIFKVSCMACHGEKGPRIATIRLNFKRWSGYREEQRAEKASAICSAVRKGIMPPRSVRESKPELILKKEQVDQVCRWAESVKAVKE